MTDLSNVRTKEEFHAALDEVVAKTLFGNSDAIPGCITSIGIDKDISGISFVPRIVDDICGMISWSSEAQDWLYAGEKWTDCPYPEDSIAYPGQVLMFEVDLRLVRFLLNAHDRFIVSKNEDMDCRRLESLTTPPPRDRLLNVGYIKAAEELVARYEDIARQCVKDELFILLCGVGLCKKSEREILDQKMNWKFQGRDEHSSLNRPLFPASLDGVTTAEQFHCFVETMSAKILADNIDRFQMGKGIPGLSHAVAIEMFGFAENKYGFEVIQQFLPHADMKNEFLGGSIEKAKIALGHATESVIDGIFERFGLRMVQLIGSDQQWADAQAEMARPEFRLLSEDAQAAVTQTVHAREQALALESLREQICTYDHGVAQLATSVLSPGGRDLAIYALRELAMDNLIEQFGSERDAMRHALTNGITFKPYEHMSDRILALTYLVHKEGMMPDITVMTAEDLFETVRLSIEQYCEPVKTTPS